MLDETSLETKQLGLGAHGHEKAVAMMSTHGAQTSLKSDAAWSEKKEILWDLEISGLPVEGCRVEMMMRGAHA